MSCLSCFKHCFFLKMMKLYRHLFCAHCFFLKMMKLYRHLFCMNKLYFCQTFFLIDRRHKHPKNTIDLLLFYGEHFYKFSECEISKISVPAIFYYTWYHGLSPHRDNSCKTRYPQKNICGGVHSYCNSNFKTFKLK